MRRLFVATLVLGVSVVGCVSDQAAESESVESELGASTQVSKFWQVAHTDSKACDGYKRIDNCYNELNPPRPSILRGMVSANQGDEGDKTVTGPADHGWRPGDTAYEEPQAPGDDKTQILPFRTSNDGRLQIAGGCHGCAPLTLSVFRPEHVGPDLRASGKANSEHAALVLPFVWYNPVDTSLPARALHSTGDDGLYGVPDALHNTMCDLGSSAVTLAPGRRRNPVACSASLQPGGAPVLGDCYDITLIVSANRHNAKWELRSSDLTVLVPRGKEAVAGHKSAGSAALGNGRALWIYPRSARPAGDGPLSMPAFSEYDIESSPWWGELGAHGTRYKAADGSIDFERAFTDAQGPFRCFDASTKGMTNGTRPIVNGAPKWCGFFAEQRWRSEFIVDDDGDGNLSNGKPWNGDARHWLFETSTTGDGGMLVSNMKGYYYAVNDTQACHADGFRRFLPLSAMPADPRANTRYPIAKTQLKNGVPMPFRDSSGEPIPFGQLNFGAYGWLDREGKNFFFAQSNRSRDGYFALTANGFSDAATPVTHQAKQKKFLGVARPVYDFNADLNPDRRPAQGQTVLGAWTQGKMVVLDNGLTHGSWGGRTSGGRWSYKVRLYEGDPIEVAPRGSSSVFSFEQQLGAYDALRPTLPFDVVWTMHGEAQRNAEVVFDEYMNNRMFVVAHMNAPVHAETGFPRDGFTADNEGADVRNGQQAGFKFRQNPLLQNATGASPDYSTDSVKPPKTLRLRGGARVEPLLLGGVLGQGVYLDGDNDFMDMGYEVQPSFQNWYLGLFIDDRSTDNTDRTVYYFADKSYVALRRSAGGASVVLRAGGITREVPLGTAAQKNRYFHLGIRLENVASGRRATVLLDGTPVGDATVPAGLNPMGGGVNGWTFMTVGDPGPDHQGTKRTLRAWIDEFRMIALRNEDVGAPWFDELSCNMALGSMVDVSVRANESLDGRLAALRAKAAKLPGSPTRVCEQLALHSYAEPLDFPRQYGRTLCAAKAHKNNPDAARCLRAELLGTKSRRLVADELRPSFSSVAFCTSCHESGRRSNAFFAELAPSALDAGNVPRWLDARRQPLDVPGATGGRLPGNLAVFASPGHKTADGAQSFDHRSDTAGFVAP